MKKVTKKEIARVLRTKDSTKIFALASRMGVDVSDKGNVFRFIKEHATTHTVFNSAYKLSYGASDFKNFKRCYKSINMPIKKAIDFMKSQIKEDVISTSYGKILVEGNNNIYWASPSYGHSDYNKSIAFENTPKNRRVMNLINNLLSKTLISGCLQKNQIKKSWI